MLNNKKKIIVLDKSLPNSTYRMFIVLLSADTPVDELEMAANRYEAGLMLCHA